MITVEELFKTKQCWSDTDPDSVAADHIQQFAIEFASMHVAATIKAIQASSVDGMDYLDEYATI